MIGVFDSGSGGLTILGQCLKLLPGHDFTYLGDHARAPYGDLGAEDIYRNTVEMVSALMKRGAGLVLIACNTASAVALRRLQEEWLPDQGGNRRVLGVLVPTVEALTGLAWDRDNPGLSEKPGQCIAVFGTPRTIASGAYSYEIARRSPASSVVPQACPDLVTAIEDGASDQHLSDLVEDYVGEMIFNCHNRPLDSVILACTHYPLVEPLFRKLLGPDIPILSQPDIVARSLKHYVERHARLLDGCEGPQSVTYLTTADPASLPPFTSFSDALAPDFHRLKG